MFLIRLHLMHVPGILIILIIYMIMFIPKSAKINCKSLGMAIKVWWSILKVSRYWEFCMLHFKNHKVHNAYKTVLRSILKKHFFFRKFKEVWKNIAYF